MHIKRFVAILLAILMTVSMFSSCSPFDILRRFIPQINPSIVEEANPFVKSRQPDRTTESETDNTEIERVRQEFDEFLEADFMEIILDNTLDMHSYLMNPADFGVDGFEVTWGDLSIYPTDEILAKDRATIEKLYSFDRNMLTREQQQSYDIYAYLAENYEDTIDSWMMYDHLVGANGYHAIIPFVLNEYYFYTEQNVKEYLTLLETVNLMFDYLIEWQQERSRLGLFMSDDAADEVIKTCRGIIAEKNNSILVTGFDERIKALELKTSLTDEYIKQNLEIYNTVVIPAYSKLIEEMLALKGTGTSKGGLAQYDKGKEFYSTQIKRMGFSKSPEQLIELVDSAIDETIDKFYSLYLNFIRRHDPALLYDMFTPELATDDIVEYLILKTAKDFPALPEGVTYNLKHIDESMRDSLSPGFYFTPPIDDYKYNSIYINPDYLHVNRDYMFFLLAHEGIPGHLLQNVTLMNSELPLWRKVQYFKGYSEGWAQYVQYYAYSYFTSNLNNVADLMRLSEELDLLIMVRMDLGIHYEGWSLEQLRRYTSTVFIYEIDDEFVGTYYDFIVDNPLQPIPYGVGMLEIKAMYNEFKHKMGNSFSDLEFHTQLLNYGEAPFSLLHDWMDETMIKHSWWQ
ncbi:MAG: DUF885 domain-containing protein [Oscillospiraceae bacterium]|nr:DUF885 domain-containing protein [Oscillospiraceae bacterium]